ncbi:unnamed protein product [Sphagnum troendelagicum]
MHTIGVDGDQCGITCYPDQAVDMQRIDMDVENWRFVVKCFSRNGKRNLNTSFSHIFKTVKKNCQYVKFQYQRQKKPFG